MKMLRRYLCRALGIAMAGLVVAVLLLGLTPQGRAMVKAALFVTQVVPAIPAQAWFQPDPTRTRVEISTPEGVRQADLYRRSGEGPYAAAVVFLGVAPAGPDDQRVIDLGNALARAGMVALVYWSPEKIAKRIHPPDVQNLVAAFHHLRGLPFVDSHRVGFAGFCVGASFVLIAAAQEEIRDDVAFVNAFGPYYDLRDLARAIGTGARFSDGEQVPWTPGELTRDVATLLLVESLDSMAERDHVRDALATGSGLGPGDLSPEAVAVHRILAGGTQEEVESAVLALPPELLAKMALASPASYVDRIEAPVLLMHDREDDLVPSGESRRLAEAMAGNPGLRHTQFSLFQHVTPSRPLRLWDLAREANKLFWHMYAIMRQTT